GLCAQRCPVGINTGELVKQLRGQRSQHPARAKWLARNFSSAMRAAHLVLIASNGARQLLGAPRLSQASALLTRASGGRVPQWTSAMPQPVRLPRMDASVADSQRPRVVYLAACVSRVMGPAASD